MCVRERETDGRVARSVGKEGEMVSEAEKGGGFLRSAFGSQRRCEYDGKKGGWEDVVMDEGWECIVGMLSWR